MGLGAKDAPPMLDALVHGQDRHVAGSAQPPWPSNDCRLRRTAWAGRKWRPRGPRNPDREAGAIPWEWWCTCGRGGPWPRLQEFFDVYGHWRLLEGGDGPPSWPRARTAGNSKGRTAILSRSAWGRPTGRDEIGRRRPWAARGSAPGRRAGLFVANPHVQPLAASSRRNISGSMHRSWEARPWTHLPRASIMSTIVAGNAVVRIIAVSRAPRRGTRSFRTPAGLAFPPARRSR